MTQTNKQKRHSKWKADGLTWIAILSVFSSLYVIYETKDLTFLVFTFLFTWIAVELGKSTTRVRRI